VCLSEQRHKEGLIKKSKLAQKKTIAWAGMKLGFLEIECKNMYRKYKESVHMACITNPIRQPSSEISRI
jgi:hypothetical protein